MSSLRKHNTHSDEHYFLASSWSKQVRCSDSTLSRLQRPTLEFSKACFIKQSFLDFSGSNSHSSALRMLLE
ncbi:MAG: hypothetical protein Q8P95_04240 [bacterium]|nr:hypothetical protein [bacterium]